MDDVLALIGCPDAVLKTSPSASGHKLLALAFACIAIAAEINPDEPFAVASCDDLANFCEPSSFLLGSQERHTPEVLAGPQTADI